MGWLDGWAFRIPLTLKETTGTDLSGKVVLIVIDNEDLPPDFWTKARADTADFRITDSDGTTLLDFWVANNPNEDNTFSWGYGTYDMSITGDPLAIFVKLGTLGPNETRTIYLYYGNSTASSVQDPTKVFSYFTQDFSGWGASNGSITTFSGSRDTILQLDASAPAGNAYAPITPAGDGMVAAVVRSMSGDNVSGLFLGSKSNGGVYVYWDDPEYKGYISDYGTYDYLSPVSVGGYSGTSHLIVALYNNYSRIRAYFLNAGGSQYFTVDTNLNSGPYHVGVGGIVSGTTPILAEWFAYSPSYVPAFPDVTVGSEETPGPVCIQGVKIQTPSGPLDLCMCSTGEASTGVGGQLRIKASSGVYALDLVPTDDPAASPVRIKTSSGIYAVRRFS